MSAWLGIAVVLAACGDDSTTDDMTPGMDAPLPEPDFKVRGSVEQVHVWSAPAATEVVLTDATGVEIASATTDALGSYMFRKIAPGTGYMVKTADGLLEAGPIDVLTEAASLPPPTFYSEQTIQPGSGYIKTRDGTTLSIYTTFPAGEGPYPTVVNYSGYDPSRPGQPLDPSLAHLCGLLPVICDAPADPSALIAAMFGYATVSVNIRGTGCSGGAFDFFETMQVLDGYDIIETVAAQPWVMHGKVGMVGLSYPGITQLFVAKSKPPHLAAITPLSVIGSAITTMRPGGILNDGFATAWIERVISRAQPYGQGWEQAQVDAGDMQCAENQLLHGQYIDNVQQAREANFYVPAEHDRFNLQTFTDTINVPVFLASAWQDEQTGPFFFTMLDHFSGSPSLRVHVYNGVHIDAFQPEVLQEWFNFLELFVAKRVPGDAELAIMMAPVLYEEVFKTDQLTIQESRLHSQPSYEAALAQWNSEKPIRALFESGAGMPAEVGAPIPTHIREFDRYATATPLRLFATTDGSLAPTAPTTTAAPYTFAHDPAAGDVTILAPGGNVWDLLPRYDWKQPAAGSAVVFEGPALTSDLVMFGSASVDLWVRSPVDEADLEVNLTEIRPDGQEVFVQAGWIRASLRAPGADGTALWPSYSLTEADAAPLVPGEWTQVRVGTAGFQHVFRAGSRIRVSVDTPGGSRSEWYFDLKTFTLNPVTYEIGHDMAHPTSIALPVITGQTSSTPYPACPSMRGQQCRTYQPYSNVTAE